LLAHPLPATEPKLRRELDRTLYAVGVAASESFRSLDLTPAELELKEEPSR